MTTKALTQRQVRWSEFLAGFDFRIVYRPGRMAVLPDALSRKAEDQPDRTDPDDDRVRNRERTVIPRDRLSEEVIQELGNFLHEDENLWRLSPMAVVLPEERRPIDDIIDAAYRNDPLTQVMATTLRAKQRGSGRLKSKNSSGSPSLTAN